MIHIKKKQDCCGCAACVQVCPKQCIEMRADNEGFFYPKVCTVNCTNCDLCEKVCPVINKNESRVPVNTVAAINTDENVRMKSSSGGIFSLLAKIVIEQDGVVFGVRFDNEWNVIHDYIDKEEDLDHFCGSKYVQSHIGNAFSQVRSYLQAGRMVLFSGTPCQVAGLYKYLRKAYGNLVTVDFVCHGVPSQKVWQSYLNYELKMKQGQTGEGEFKSFKKISFRNKTNGWKKYNIELIFSDSQRYMQYFAENPYMIGFINNLYLRPSCYHCAFRSFRSHSNFTLADFWGVENIHPEIDDDKGVSVLFVNDNNAYVEKLLNRISYKKVSFDDVVLGNRSIVSSYDCPQYRHLFFKKLSLGFDFNLSILKPNLFDRVMMKIERTFQNKC